MLAPSNARLPTYRPFPGAVLWDKVVLARLAVLNG